MPQVFMRNEELQAALMSALLKNYKLPHYDLLLVRCDLSSRVRLRGGEIGSRRKKPLYFPVLKMSVKNMERSPNRMTDGGEEWTRRTRTRNNESLPHGAARFGTVRGEAVDKLRPNLGALRREGK